MLRALLSALAAALLLAPPASATWSIVLVDVRTGEVAVASATCLTGLDLANLVPIVVVGQGAGAAQSFIDSSGSNRVYIRDQLRLGTDPAQILAGLAQRDPGHQTRQYGIVDTQGRAIGFSGTGAGAYAGDRVGRVGDIAHAIQGNVLTGGAVLAAAELALYNTPGDLAEKLMAAMEAARSCGGDGRCSCAGSTPTSCGAPPPGFTKSADIGFMIIARPGDVDGTCGAPGCANGAHYLRLNVANQQRPAPDPVVQLRTLFDAWKASERGRPDHFLSTVTLSTPSLAVDGVSRAIATVVLRDREGNQLTSGGATITATLDPSSTTNPTFLPAIDHGDGTYSLPIQGGTTPGIARFDVAVDDGTGPRRLGPRLVVPAFPQPLWVSHVELSQLDGGRLDFALQAGASNGANRPWILLASLSGTSPGILFPPFHLLPLNRDALLDATLHAAFSGAMPELLGTFPASGYATTAITIPRGGFAIPVGQRLAFAYAVFNPVSFTSNPVIVRVVP